MAIALDGGVPDYGSDRPAGQSLRGIFRRQREDPGAGRRSLADLDDLDDLGRARALDTVLHRWLAHTDSVAADDELRDSPPVAEFDARLVQESFARICTNAPLAMEYFYSHLFAANPETRAMFPMGMSQLREHVFGALGHLVRTLDNPEECARYLAQLGRDHRKYGVKEKHYHAFFDALLDTAEYFSGTGWTAQAAASWRGALEHAGRTMRTAAQADARQHPPWWVAEIETHEQRSDTVAVLKIRPDRPLPYRPGQYVPVQVTRWPRIWRPYSIANAPRPDGLLELHVRAVPGGMVSTALVRHARAGDTVVLGPAGGGMVPPDPGRDLLCVAGGTGLAPIKAIIEDIAVSRTGAPRNITLLVGARRRGDLYDLPGLWALQEACPGLQVIPVLSDEPADPALTGITGQVPDVAHEAQFTADREVLICGPEAMVRRTEALLLTRFGPERIHHELPPPERSAASSAAAMSTATISAARRGDFSQSSLFAKFARPGVLPGTDG